MSSNQKHSSLGWTLAISLGIALSAGVVHASSIGDTYTAGDTLTAAKMDNIKAAVNDNDTRIGTLTTTVGGHTTSIGTLTTDVNNLKNGTPTCATGMTAVGPICVDDTRQAANATWSEAVDTCRAAGKRLLTPSEYLSAKNSLSFSDMTNFEWVDSVGADAFDGATPPLPAGRLTVGYMGPDDGTNITAGDIFFASNAAYDAAFPFIYYRCAR